MIASDRFVSLEEVGDSTRCWWMYRLLLVSLFSKLRMLEFYYDCIDRFVDRKDFQYIKIARIWRALLLWRAYSNQEEWRGGFGKSIGCGSLYVPASLTTQSSSIACWVGGFRTRVAVVIKSRNTTITGWDNLLLCHETGPWALCFYNPFRYYLKVLVSQHVLESRSQILGLHCTFGWLPKQTSLPFFDYIRNATRWPGTSLLGHWCSWNNMGNIVGMSRWASRDRDFYTPIRPQMYYDEHAEVMSVKVVMKMCFPQNLVVVARDLPNQ